MKKHTAPNHIIPSSLVLPRGRELGFERPMVMGILNVTPDSFSDGGENLRPDAAVSRALRMVGEGADIIDIGGESTRPGAEVVSLEEEQRRVLPVIEAIRKQSDIPISIDTYKAEVARKALAAGADMVNDISGLRLDGRMVELAATSGVPMILMHMKGTPRDMQQNPTYQDCVGEIGEFFAERLSWCESRGLDRSRLILDPGIGFGKRVTDNLEILARLAEFTSFGCPILVGASRKSFIAQIHKAGTPPADRLGGSIAAALVAVTNGASLIRVHDVAPTVEALRLWSAVRGIS